MDLISSTSLSSSDRSATNKSIILGIHVEGIFLFEAGSKKELSEPHKMIDSYFWHKIGRIQYDKTRFQLLVQTDPLTNFPNVNSGSSYAHEKNVKKLKFYVSENKAKFLFDLSSAHHQYSNRQKLRDNQRIEIAVPVPISTNQNKLTQSTDVEYKEPQRAMRSLKSRFFLSRRNISQRKLYTNSSNPTHPRARSQSRDRDSISNRCRRLSGRLISSSTSSPSRNDKQGGVKTSITSEQRKGYMVKRLAHYTSMADALLHPKTPTSSRYQQDENEFNISDKENTSPNNKYK